MYSDELNLFHVAVGKGRPCHELTAHVLKNARLKYVRRKPAWAPAESCALHFRSGTIPSFPPSHLNCSFIVTFWKNFPSWGVSFRIRLSSRDRKLHSADREYQYFNHLRNVHSEQHYCFKWMQFVLQMHRFGTVYFNFSVCLQFSRHFQLQLYFYQYYFKYS